MSQDLDEAARFVGGIDNLIASAQDLLDALRSDVRSQGALEAHDDAKALRTTANAIAVGYEAYDQLLERLEGPGPARGGPG